MVGQANRACFASQATHDCKEKNSVLKQTEIESLCGNSGVCYMNSCCQGSLHVLSMQEAL